MHYIGENSLSQLVLHSVQRISAKVVSDEAAFCDLLKTEWQKKNEAVPKKSKKELVTAQRRYEELDTMISGLYENFVYALIPERQYKSLMSKYDAEQAELETRIEQLQKQITETKTASIDTKKFLEVIEKYKAPTELTRTMVCDLIDKIVIHEAVGKKPNREQKIDIYYNFIGKFELAYTAEEIAKAKAEAKQQAEKKQAQKAERAYERSKAFREKEKAERWEANNGHKFAQRICEHCGKPYYPNSSKQKYCSKDCNYAAQQQVVKEKRLAEKGTHTFLQKECKVCGKKFWPSNGREVLCSEECKVENRRRKQLDYY